MSVRRQGRSDEVGAAKVPPPDEIRSEPAKPGSVPEGCSVHHGSVAKRSKAKLE